MLSPIGAEPPVKGPDKPILIGASVADKTSIPESSITKNTTRLNVQKKAAVTVHLPSLFSKEDFRELSDTVYQDVSSVVNKSPIRKNSSQKTKKPALSRLFAQGLNAQDGRFILQEVGCEAT
jgi:hypothetical protein